MPRGTKRMGASSRPAAGVTALRGTRNPMKRTGVGRMIAKPYDPRVANTASPSLRRSLPVTLMGDAASD